MTGRWGAGLAGVTAMIGLVAGCAPDDPTPAPTTTPPPASQSVTTQSSPAGVKRPTPTPLQPSPSASATAAATARDFVTAWLTTDPVDRQQRLADTAVPHLAQLLTQTDPAEIPDARIAGAPREVALPDSQRPEHAADAVRFHVDLSDGSAVLVDLIPDGSDHWLAAAIRAAD